MMPTNKNGKWISALMSAVIGLAMWSNAMAVVFCPHMRGGRDCCLLDRAHVHPRTIKQDDPAPADQMHMNHEQMSDMDTEDGSMDMSETDRPAAERDSNFELTSVPARTSSDEQAVTQPNEPCSHCMMHSRSGERFPISIVQNSASDHIVSPDNSATSVHKVPALLTIVELHDHGPPGPDAPLYVLVSSFRI